MTSAIIWLESSDPAAQFVEPVQILVEAWARSAPAEYATAIRDAILSADPSPLRDDGVASVTIPAALLGPELAGEARIDLVCRTILSPGSTPEAPPAFVARRIDVTVHPVPTIGGPDLSGVVTLTALALAIGGQEVTRRGWAWALAIPGTSWVIGRPEVPGLTYGIGAAEDRKPTRGVTAWREAQRQRLEVAMQVVAAADAADGQDTTA